MGLLDRIIYQKVDLGLRTKDGKVYKKLVKRRRFPSFPNLTAFFLVSIIMLLILGLMAMCHFSQLSFELPAVDVEAPIE